MDTSTYRNADMATKQASMEYIPNKYEAKEIKRNIFDETWDKRKSQYLLSTNEIGKHYRDLIHGNINRNLWFDKSDQI